MLDKLLKIKGEYEETAAKLGDPSVVADQKKYRELAKKESRLRPIVELIRKYEAVCKRLAEAEAILDAESDHDLITMA
ncbi:PCRF domain-containing protein, partial [Candidatus Peregrinibacteria bacterium]|nr:PCRF domain-containing protein [Candidatus Peregrinibacteria bacterium]